MFSSQALCGFRGCCLLLGFSETSHLDFLALSAAGLVSSFRLSLVSPLDLFLDSCLPSICSNSSISIANSLQLPTNLCPLLVSQQGVGLAAAFQVICMSDQNLIALTFAIERLTLSTERLAQELQRHRLATSTSDSPVPPIAAASVEGGRVPFPGEFVNHCALLRYRGAEDGPGSVPAFAVLHCVEKLSADKAPGPEERAKFAYRSGFWASIAISTRTGFNQVQAQGLRNNHWIDWCFPSNLPP